MENAKKSCCLKGKMVYKHAMALQETFIENLKFFRKSARLSQKDLSIALNKGFNYINSIECGASFPPPAVIDQISEILKIEPEVLFSRRGGQQGAKVPFSQLLKKELTTGITREIERICDELAK